MNKELVDVKIDELLSVRNNLKQNLRRINRLLKQSFEHKKDFPFRWYVSCTDVKQFKPVYEYLQRINVISEYNHFKNAIVGCGYGLIDGELLFIPEDCNYDDSREITLEEFNFIIKLKKG